MEDYSVLFRLLIIFTCSLSVIGSLSIIASYAFFKSLRNHTRLILVHLSIMDLGAAIANLIGIAANFDKYYYHNGQISEDRLIDVGLPHPSRLVNIACISQAAFAVYFTAGSFMWTLCMAVYLYFKIVHREDDKLAKKTLYVSTAVSYLLPLLFVGWKCSQRRLGFTPHDSGGWCGDKYNPGDRYVLMSILSYNLWVLLIYTLVPVLYLAMLLHIRLLMKQQSAMVTSAQWWNLVDIKLLLIPFAFLMLRIWSLILQFAYLYLNIELRSDVSNALLFLSGIGDSGQGFINAILFVLLTKKVRDQLFCKCCQKKCNSQSMQSSEGKQLLLEDGSIQKHSPSEST